MVWYGMAWMDGMGMKTRKLHNHLKSREHPKRKKRKEKEP
jgi:hypothetical protein